MKRFHVNLTVKDIDKSVAFYNELFAAEPVIRKDDYAKWMLDDPFVNFSVSTKGTVAGVDHVGIEASSEDELALIRERLVKADSPIFDQEAVNCCYAESKKAWIRDPDGVAWETFHTTGQTTNYGDGVTPERAHFAEAPAERCCG
ncbi:ArsI/CadI family heavy metal resistance metalloenzyme [Hyphobacterium sp.]|jgi:predicted lactoylglutathione lyase|uniref:ArsI/CadI family heavy metal resistance metalloenzyme n=1 Tax=Hyphobacterium sp. TaxID=2004662 RepID=UPI003BAD1882